MEGFGIKQRIKACEGGFEELITRTHSLLPIVIASARFLGHSTRILQVTSMTRYNELKRKLRHDSSKDCEEKALIQIYEFIRCASILLGFLEIRLCEQGG